QEKAAGTVFSYGEKLHPLAVARRPELVVWPETSWSEEWDSFSVEEDGGRIPKSQGQLRQTARAARTSLLVGLNTRVGADEHHHKRYNSALLIGPDPGVLGRYDKIHRVPFGEF